MSILTLGHSTHTPERFVEICRAARVQVVIDVRSHRSSKWEWWRGEQMDHWLPQAGLETLACLNLGGWSEQTVEIDPGRLAYWDERGVDLRPYLKGHFPKQRIGVKKPADQPTLDGDPALVSGWTNQGLHDYAWYTSTPAFREGLEWLVARFGANTQPRAVIVCAELLWWKCHRSMVADVLEARSVPATHLTPTPAGVRTDRHPVADRLSRYPDAVRASWRT